MYQIFLDTALLLQVHHDVWQITPVHVRPFCNPVAKTIVIMSLLPVVSTYMRLSIAPVPDGMFDMSGYEVDIS